jgi:hypothetical protein
MELLYLWIDWYNNIKNQEFLFSSEFDIKLNVNEEGVPSNKAEGILTIKKVNEQKINIFHESFLNVSVIIGKNGSGKTSLLSFLKRIFKAEAYLPESYIAVIKDEEGLLVIIDKFSNRKRILTHTPSKHVYGIIENEERILNYIKLIYQSNSFSIYEDKRFKGNIIDVSLDHLIHDQSIESNKILISRHDSLNELLKDNPDKESDIKIRKEWDIDGILPEYLIFKLELNNQINFALKYKDKKWNFIPSYTEIGFNSTFLGNNIEFLKKVGLSDKTEKLKKIIFEEPIYPRTPIEAKAQFQKSLYISLFLYLIKNNNIYHIGETEIDQLLDTLTQTTEIDEIIEIFHKILLSGKIKSEYHDLAKVKEIVNLFDAINIEFQFSNYNYNRYPFVITQELCNFLDKIFNFWYDKDFIFYFDWGNLSAGESALLSLFSRLPKFRGSHKKDCIWLLIDEGELYLHPEWQRQYFSDLHKYLPQFYPNMKIQLFLTSHSPYVVSDFPKQNIILLDKDDNGYCKIVPHEQFGNTMGANISSLLSSSFFLDYQIGDFAKDYIFKLLEEIEKSEKSDDNYKSLSNKIEIIGEPLIKEKLFRSLYQKFAPDEIEKRKKFLQDELEKLG